MKRILLTVHKFFPDHRAGTEVLTLKVAQELKRRGNEVMVVTANPPDQDARHKDGNPTSDHVYEGIPVHVVEEPLRTAGYTFAHEYYHPIIGEHFSDVIASFAPDIVHVVHAQNLSASIIDAARRRGIPAVCTVTDFWFICPIIQLRKPDGKLCRGPAAYASNCLTCYTPRLMPSIIEFKKAIRSKYPGCSSMMLYFPAALRDPLYKVLHAAYVTRKFLPAASATVQRLPRLISLINETDALMVPTRLMWNLFVENGINESLLHHVRFGIDTSELTPCQHETASKKLRIGFIGTIAEHKGVDLLINAFQMLPHDAPVSLYVYGDMQQFPDYSAMLMKLTRNELLENGTIQFAGRFPNSEFGQRLAEIDVLVVPSRWYENTPLVIQSALATKTPVIATNLGGMSELIEHDKNGLLFDLNSVNSLYRQLLRLLQEPELLLKLKAGIEPERSISQMVDDIEEVYEKCCRRGGKFW